MVVQWPSLAHAMTKDYNFNKMNHLHALNRFSDMYTLSHCGNWNQKGGRVTLRWLVAFSNIISVLWYITLKKSSWTCGGDPIECQTEGMKTTK